MKKVFLCLFAMLAILCLAACNGKGGGASKADITVEFEGASSIVVSAEGVYNLPELELEAGKTVLGWALKANANKALFKDDITYSDIADFAANGKLKLYPVIESKIQLTMKGITDVVTQLSNMSLNNATLPLVAQNDRQKFLGWAATEGAKEPQIAAGAQINYETVEKLAVNAKVTLYPVVETYDIMICVHGSHSNGNIYITTEQRAELRAVLEEAFPEQKILIDYVDGVSAANFAVDAVKKDYDIVLTSKTARNATNGDPGDIATAAIAVGKTIYAEADSNDTTLSCIDLRQSRQVCKVLGSEEPKAYQAAVYTFLTTPVDKIIEITFINGDKKEVVEAHRVVDGKINNVAYEPSQASGIMNSLSQVFDGWTLEENGTTVDFANASYAKMLDKAENGKITLYPVFKKAPDAYILVWGLNGENEYVSESQYNKMVELFDAYLKANSISKDGKDVQIVYFQGKTADFQSELTKTYVLAAVGASALSNDTYAAYWTINKAYYSKVVNVSCTNASRYCALRDGAEANEFALAFFNTLCSDDITVKFSNGTTTSDEFTANSLTKNVIELPEAYAAPAGKVLSGFATTAGGEVVITGNVTYSTVAEFAVEGQVTLYPIYENDSSYDLTVAILRGTGTSEYITVAEVEAIKEAFVTYAAGKGVENVNVEYIVNDGAKGADFIKALPATTDVYIGASNLTSQAGFPGMYETEAWTNIIRMMANTSRYVGVVATCDASQADLAKMFVAMLTEPEAAPPAGEATQCTVAYHAYGSKQSTIYVSDAMLAKIQEDVTAALVAAGYKAEDYEITWVSYNGTVANASAAITTAGADVCLAHTQVFSASKTETPFVCASSGPAVQFSNSTAEDTFFCGSALKVGVADGSETNPIAMIIYNIVKAYAK